MKKIFALLLFVSMPLVVFSQENGFTIDGEVKTGFIWEKNETIGKDGYEEPETKVKLGSLDDAGNGQGRIRINIAYVNGNVGIKGRLQWDDWQNTQKAPEWPYLFGYVNSFEDQLTMSLGKLGASPWGTGGPEKWKELESNGRVGGIRLEYKPNFVPGLNAGFVLNWYDGNFDRGIGKEVTLLDLLQESVLGFSYENEYFLMHFEYRLDSEVDQRPGSFASGREGDDLVYRVEEHIIEKTLANFKIWALGVYEGVGAEHDECIRFVNWLFVEYAPEWFTAQIRLGYDVVETRSILHIKPSYYHNLFNGLLSIGASFYYANDFGDIRINQDAPYTEIQLEPKIQINFANGYIAFTYNFKQIYKQPQENIADPIERFQTMNLRFGMKF